MKIKKKSAVMLCGVFCTALTAVPVLADIEVQKYTNTDFAMDTVVSETLYTTGDDLNTAIGQKIRDIETEYLSWTDEDSQIAKLNAASGETTEVSDELAGYLEKIFQLANDSNGALIQRLERSFVSGILQEKILMSRSSQSWMNF